MENTRQFTLRLNSHQNSKIERLKELTMSNTDSGAIKIAIENYSDLNDRYLNEQRKNIYLQKENEELRELIDNFKRSLNLLINI